MEMPFTEMEKRTGRAGFRGWTNLDIHFGRFLGFFFYVGIVCHQIKLEKQDPQEKGSVVC